MWSWSSTAAARSVSHEAEPGEIQIFYSRDGQTADSIIERLASKYAERFRLVVATGDYLEQETASASGAETVSPEGLRDLLAGSTPSPLIRTCSGTDCSDALGSAKHCRVARHLFVPRTLPAGREDSRKHAIKLLNRQILAHVAVRTRSQSGVHFLLFVADAGEDDDRAAAAGSRGCSE